jgi:hypothetical protein
MDSHTHDPLTGNVIIDHKPEADLEAAEIVTEASVQIARIEADKEITLAKIQAKMIEPELETQLAAALAELDALRAIVTPPQPEPAEQSAPIVIVDDSSSDEQPEPTLDQPADEQEHQEQPKRKPIGLGAW